MSPSFPPARPSPPLASWAKPVQIRCNYSAAVCDRRRLTSIRRWYMVRYLTGLAALALAAAPAAAQEPATRFFVEGLGGAVVPTFDINDVAKTGAAFGGALGYRLNDSWTVMGEFDYGFHKDQATGNADIKTLHY